MNNKTFTTPAESMHFVAEDGYMLSGMLYSAEKQSKASIVVGSATGVPQGFYRHFAQYAAQHGFDVLTFDYRGVAASAPARLKGFEMHYLDWGRYDLSAAIDVMLLKKQPVFLVGHSFGGQALGLTRNHHLLGAMYCFASGAGWHGYMPFKERLKVYSFWNLVFPALVSIYGYLPWQKFNMGANLPLDVYRQWRKWCNNPHYFFDEPDLAYLADDYATVQIPIYAASALDDDWALAASRHAFMQYYRQAKLTEIDLNPQDYSLQHVGHMGYFRQGAEAIWDEVLSCFETYLP